MNLLISSLTAADAVSFAQLLEQSGLPTTDLPENLPHFFKAEIDGTLVGSAGLEMYNNYALLRSVAVDEAYRSQKIGEQLYKKAMQYAKNQGITEVYLITNTADGYFQKRGFVKVERNTVPQAIQQTQQFQGVCPSSATIMKQLL